MIRTAILSTTLLLGGLANAATAAGPSDARECADWARLFQAEGRLRPAEVLANEAIRLDKTLADAYLTRGMVRLERGDAAGAVVDIDQSLRIGLIGTDAPYRAYGYRGWAHAILGNAEASERDLTSAMKFARDDEQKAEVYFLRGAARGAGGKAREGIADISTAIELDPGRRIYYQTRGNLYKKLGMTDRAERDFAKADSMK